MAPEIQTAFFSYCREDSEFALKLAEDLKAAGSHVWIDQLDIEPGTPWDRAVEEALNKAPRMLVVLSPVSVNSDNVRDEVSFALSKGKRVIPVLYRDCDLPFRLARLQYIDFRPDYGRGLQILLRAMGVADAGHPVPGAAVDVVASGSALSTEEAATARYHEEELERERLEAARRKEHDVRLVEDRHDTAAGERRAAAERARVEQEKSDARALQEQSRRQRLAEQARLAEEARQAAEKARSAQEERARKEAEIKARQEQLRREEQESVERRRFDMAQIEQQKREAAAVTLQQAAHRESQATARSAVSLPDTQTGHVPRALKLYIPGAVVLVLLIALTIFVVKRNKAPAPGERKGAERHTRETAGTMSSPLPQLPNSAANSTPSSPAPGVSSAQPNNRASSQVPRKGAELAGKSAAVSSAMSKGPTGVARVQLPADVSKSFLESEAVPVYPPLARQARIHGTVKLQIVIDKNGAVQNIKTVSGHPMLVPAAVDAVKQWRYRPFVVDNKPVEVDTIVTVNFTLTN